MTKENVEKALVELRATYGSDLAETKEGARTFARIRSLDLPKGCQPAETPMLLMFDPACPKPIPYVQVGQLLANGKTPRSTSIVFIAGGSWLQYSFNIPWVEGQSILRFIGSASLRFSQND